MTLDDLAEAVKDASRTRIVLCRPEMVSDVEEIIYRYSMDDHYKVLASIYVPEGKIFVLSTGDI